MTEYLPVEWVERDAIAPNDWNPNEMDDERLAGLRQSIQDNGWTQPIVVHATDRYIIDGEHRWQVAAELSDPDITPVDVPPTHVPVFGVTMADEQAQLATVQHNRARGTMSVESVESFVAELESLGVLETTRDRLTFNSDACNAVLEPDAPTPDIGTSTSPDIRDDDASESTDTDSTPSPSLRTFPSLAGRNVESPERVQTTLTAEEYELVMQALGAEERGQSLVNLVRYVQEMSSVAEVNSYEDTSVTTE